MYTCTRSYTRSYTCTGVRSQESAKRAKPVLKPEDSVGNGVRFGFRTPVLLYIIDAHMVLAIWMPGSIARGETPCAPAASKKVSQA